MIHMTRGQRRLWLRQLPLLPVGGFAIGAARKWGADPVVFWLAASVLAACVFLWLAAEHDESDAARELREHLEGLEREREASEP